MPYLTSPPKSLQNLFNSTDFVLSTKYSVKFKGKKVGYGFEYDSPKTHIDIRKEPNQWRAVVSSGDFPYIIYCETLPKLISKLKTII